MSSSSDKSDLLGNGRDPSSSSFFRKWWMVVIVVLIVIAGAGLGVFFLVFHNPSTGASNSLPNQGQNGNSHPLPNNPTNGGDGGSTGGAGSNGTSVDDSAAPNSNVPPLNQPFPYGKKPIRGVNLGGWLVLEPFITPSFFGGQIIDEWTLCQSLGPEKANATLDQHYSTFITESDFAEIASYGLDHVRIPIGYWAIDVVNGEPFVPKLSWTYLLKGIAWARKYGIRVLLDLHAAPGSQNGWNHSGRQGSIGLIEGPNGKENADRTLRIIGAIAVFMNKPEYQHVVPMFGVLNEPRLIDGGISLDAIKLFNKNAYDIVRNVTGTNKDFIPWLLYHDGFLGLGAWKGYMKGYNRVAMDTHSYVIFDKDLLKFPKENLLVFPCAVWGPVITQSTIDIGPIITGEWTVSVDDCATYLNGVGNPPQYTSNCPTCSCAGSNDYKSYTPEKKAFMKQFVLAQLDTFEKGAGWFYWTWKTENHVNPTWDYQIGVQEGWIPKDLQNRPNTCTELEQQYPAIFKQLAGN